MTEEKSAGSLCDKKNEEALRKNKLKESKNEKVFNFRAPFLAALCAACGILSGALKSVSDSSLPFIIPLLIFLVAVAVLSVKNSYFYAIVLLFSAVCFLFCYFGTSTRVASNLSKSFSGSVAIDGTARVRSVAKSDEGYLVYAEGFKSVGGGIEGGLMLETEEEVFRGDVVEIKGKAVHASVAGFNMNPLKNRYDYYVYSPSVTIKERSADVFSKLSALVTRAVIDNSSGEGGGVCVALLFGDTRYLGEEAYRAFSLAGVAHIFAVSGLHIGFLAAILGFLFDKIGLKRGFKTAVVTLAITAYSGLCGFSISSIRAVIMYAVSGFAKSFGLKYDLLNSVSVAFLIVAAAFPESLFSYGTILSFGAVTSICFLAPAFSSRLSFLPEKPRSSLSVSIAVFLGTLPVIARMTGSASAFTVAFNLLTVPFASVLFTLAFIGGWASAISGAFGFLLAPANFLANFIASVYSFLKIERQVVALSFSFLPALLLYASVLVFSDKLNFPRRVKNVALVASVCSVALFI